MTPPNTTKDTTKGATEPSTSAAANRKAGRLATDVNGRLEDIEEYLTKLAVALDKYKWGTDPLELTPAAQGGSGQGVGSTPPKWPP